MKTITINIAKLVERYGFEGVSDSNDFSFDDVKNEALKSVSILKKHGKINIDVSYNEQNNSATINYEEN